MFWWRSTSAVTFRQGGEDSGEVVDELGELGARRTSVETFFIAFITFSSTEQKVGVLEPPCRDKHVGIVLVNYCVRNHGC